MWGTSWCATFFTVRSPTWLFLWLETWTAGTRKKSLMIWPFLPMQQKVMSEPSSTIFSFGKICGPLLFEVSRPKNQYIINYFKICSWQQPSTRTHNWAFIQESVNVILSIHGLLLSILPPTEINSTCNHTSISLTPINIWCSPTNYLRDENHLTAFHLGETKRIR